MVVGCKDGGRLPAGALTNLDHIVRTLARIGDRAVTSGFVYDDVAVIVLPAAWA